MDQKQAKTPSVKQQIVDKLKSANSILITVSDNPSIDQLSACLGLALLLNKLEKHTSAVFSGQVPLVMGFLKPEQTFEATTDSLRDFIISLDKAKADKLRYKVEDDVVKIFITPYKTSITSDDLMFTQGDFNIDAIIALGVTDSDHLDRAVLENGRILHDATVMTLACGEGPASVLGSLNAYEPAASSLSEMVVSMAEALKPGMLDSQISTALLTGIVERTDRFKNERTTPKTMTMSAQLMAAGANQQLVADQLTIMPEIEELPKAVEPEPEIELDLIVDTEDPVVESEVPVEPDSMPASDDKEMVFSIRNKPVEEVKLGAEAESEEYQAEAVDSGKIDEIVIDDHGQIVEPPESSVAQSAAAENPYQKVIQPLNPEPKLQKTELNGYVFDAPTYDSPMSAMSDVSQYEDMVDVMSDPLQNAPAGQEISLPEPKQVADFPIDAPEQSLADLEAAIGSPHATDPSNARDSVKRAINDPNYQPIRPEHRADLNANPGIELQDEAPKEHTNSTEQLSTAPVVPPPLPQFMQR